MKLSQTGMAYLQLHIATVLYGLTAILGDLISLNALPLVWWRVMLTSISLLIFVNWGLRILRMDRKTVLKLMGIGALVGLHWVTFYGAVKLSNASVTLAAFATTSLFTSLIEPVITSKSFDKLELFIGILVIPAILLIVNHIDTSHVLGFQVALFSAFLAALFATLNKKMVHEADAYELTFIEMSSAFLFLSIFLPFQIGDGVSIMPESMDWIYLIVLALACTTFAFIICMKALRYVSAFDANLVINLEPVYGIILAVIILKEHKELSGNFYWGALMILLIVFSHPFIKRWRRKSQKEIKP